MKTTTLFLNSKCMLFFALVLAIALAAVDGNTALAAELDNTVANNQKALVAGSFQLRTMEDMNDEYDYLTLVINCLDVDYGPQPVCYGDTKVCVSLWGVSDGWDENTYPDCLVPNALASITIDGKTYSGITNSKGRAWIKIPIVKIGTKGIAKCQYGNWSTSKAFKIKGTQYKYSFYEEDESDSEWNSYTLDKMDRREKFYRNIKILPTYASSKKTSLKVVGVTKGDYFKIKVGKKTYTKKVRKSAKRTTIAIPHPEYDAGTTIQVTQYNKFKQKMGTAKSIVFSGSKLKKGMTKKQVKLLRLFGNPSSYSNATYGWWEYDSYNGDYWTPYLCIYFQGGRVTSWTTY